MSQPALPRYEYYQGPKRLPDLWALGRSGLTLRCEIATHRLGWELKLSAGANRLRTQVCKGEAEVHKTSDAWKTEATGQGWA